MVYCINFNILWRLVQGLPWINICLPQNEERAGNKPHLYPRPCLCLIPGCLTDSHFLWPFRITDVKGCSTLPHSLYLSRNNLYLVVPPKRAPAGRLLRTRICHFWCLIQRGAKSVILGRKAWHCENWQLLLLWTQIETDISSNCINNIMTSFILNFIQSK